MSWYWKNLEGRSGVARTTTKKYTTELQSERAIYTFTKLLDCSDEHTESFESISVPGQKDWPIFSQLPEESSYSRKILLAHRNENDKKIEKSSCNSSSKPRGTSGELEWKMLPERDDAKKGYFNRIFCSRDFSFLSSLSRCLSSWTLPPPPLCWSLMKIRFYFHGKRKKMLCIAPSINMFAG